MHAWAQDLRYCTISDGDHWPSGFCFMSSQGGFKSAGIRLVMILNFSSSSRLAAPEMKVVTAIVSLLVLKEFVFITKVGGRPSSDVTIKR